MAITGASRKQAGLYYDKGGAVFNVMHPDFGAVGNGIADDGPSIQLAIDAASALYVATGVKPWVYLPHGTFRLATLDVDGYTLLKAKSGVSVFGPGILKAADGLRTTSTGIAILYNNTEALADITYRDFTVDFNGLNNLFVTGYGTTANINRLGGNAGCTNILCDNLTLKNSAGRHFLLFAGTGSTNVVLRNNKVSEWGQSIAGNQVTDVSCFYVDADQSEVVGNSIVNANVCEISTAIETHGSVNVHDNYVKNSGTAWNLGGDVRDTRDVHGHHNRFRNVRDGVIIYTASGFALSHVKIDKNIIGVREPTGAFPAGAGIDGTSSFNASSVNVSHLSIEDNEIFGETKAALTALTNGITLNRCDDLKITGNKIHDLVGEAVVLASESTPRDMSRIKILGNVFDTCGITSTSGRHRVVAFNSINTAGQKINDLEFSNNTIRCASGGGTTPDYGVNFNNGSFPDVRFLDNKISGFVLLPYNKAATIATDYLLVKGAGAILPWNNLRASTGSEWIDTTASPFRSYKATEYASEGSASIWTFVNFERVSGDKGDADTTLVDGQDESNVWYNTPLTAARSVNLPVASQQNRGCKFHIVRSASCTGAFNLNIKNSGGSTLKALTAASQTATFVSNGAAFRHVNTGTL